tara:strand:+ start:2162 stop:4354 length:2193 start_codon:yes stop_codon:yes gene_type:complete
MDFAISRDAGSVDGEFRLASRVVKGEVRQSDLSVPGIHCGGCIRRIEKALGALPNVVHVRVNLSTKRVALQWHGDQPLPPVMSALNALGFEAYLVSPSADEDDKLGNELLRAVAVSGFAAANIMALSVSVWLGAVDETRDLLHWISALIALPALAYAGRIFFRSAWSSLRHGRTNMDVPISIGVLMAFGMSLYDTIHQGPHAYFDAAVTLLFFLLIGRWLDHRMREKARSAVKGLASYAARGANVRQMDGAYLYAPLNEIEEGMEIMLAAGERVPVDALVVGGNSELDLSLVTGESLPVAAALGATLRAGTLNLTGPLMLRATAVANASFLAEVMRLMEAAEAGRGIYRRIADRASDLYAPVVHLAAFLSFLGWMMIDGDVHHAITIAVSVLIITCPCALGLAVPMVQMMAARRLFAERIMIRDGSALEKIAEIDRAVFDKTGTLTMGKLTLRGAGTFASDVLALAGAMAACSSHPCSRAIDRAAKDVMDKAPPLDVVCEVPGFGIEAEMAGASLRLGRAEWALGDAGSKAMGTWLSRDGEALACFEFDDVLRPDAPEMARALAQRGIGIEIISGDGFAPVSKLAGEIGVARFSADALPGDKLARIAALAAEGRKVLMVGDGLNDAPALVSAYVSMAPASAADVGRNAADFVFLKDSLGAVLTVLDVASESAKLIRQNFSLAILYNVIALPAAVLGYVTPLVAALAMSSSSIIVVLNALRLREKPRRANT